MNFLNEIEKESLIICNDSDKEEILKRNKLINIKVMNMNEFISKYCFEYDENAILYLMNKYSVKYEIALMYIKNLYYIENKKYGVKKLDFLVNIKRELDENKLLKYNFHFQKFIKKVSLIIYGIRLNKFELKFHFIPSKNKLKRINNPNILFSVFSSEIWEEFTDFINHFVLIIFT